MALSSQLALDVEALFLGHSFLMADPMGPLLDQDEEEALSPSSLEGSVPASPPLSFSSPSPYESLSSSPLSSASPPPSPPPNYSSFLGTKAGTHSLSFPLLDSDDLLDAHVGADGGTQDAFSGMDWMSEKIDLSDFDLESLISSCASDEPPSSPEELLASLDPHMDLALDSFDAPATHNVLALQLQDLPSLPLELPLSEAAEVGSSEMTPAEEEEEEEDVVVKSEPPSPSPPSPADTLELGSEVDVLDVDKTAPTLTATIIPDASGSIQTTTPFMVSLPSGQVMVVLAPKDETPLVALPSPAVRTSPPSSDSDSDSGIESVGGSPPRLPSSPPTASAGSSRTKPYSKPEPSTTAATAPSPKVKSVSGAPKVVEKKLKKMEQNKTAATRYRQKKRVEQDVLNGECAELEKRNHELAEKAESISREIQYLKDLMEEVRNAKHRRSKTSSVA